jgi:hypothetical protein
MVVAAFVGVMSGLAIYPIFLYATWTTLPIWWALTASVGATLVTSHLVSHQLCKWFDPE